MSMLEGYWDIEGIRQVEDEELREEVSRQKDTEFVLILKSLGKSPEEIAYLTDMPLEKVKSILEANNSN